MHGRSDMSQLCAYCLTRIAAAMSPCILSKSGLLLTGGFYRRAVGAGGDGGERRQPLPRHAVG